MAAALAANDAVDDEVKRDVLEWMPRLPRTRTERSASIDGSDEAENDLDDDEGGEEEDEVENERVGAPVDEDVEGVEDEVEGDGATETPFASCMCWSAGTPQIFNCDCSSTVASDVASAAGSAVPFNSFFVPPFIPDILARFSPLSISICISHPGGRI